MKTTAEVITKFRWPIIVAFIATAPIFTLQISKAETDPDMMNYLPEDMPSRISKDKIEDLLGGTEILMLLVKTDNVRNPQILNRVKKISKQMKRVKGVDKVLSLF